MYRTMYILPHQELARRHMIEMHDELCERYGEFPEVNLVNFTLNYPHRNLQFMFCGVERLHYFRGQYIENVVDLAEPTCPQLKEEIAYLCAKADIFTKRKNKNKTFIPKEIIL